LNTSPRIERRAERLSTDAGVVVLREIPEGSGIAPGMTPGAAIHGDGRRSRMTAPRLSGRAFCAPPGARAARAARSGRRRRPLPRDVDRLPIDVHGHRPKAAWNGRHCSRIAHPRALIPSSPPWPEPATCPTPASGGPAPRPAGGRAGGRGDLPLRRPTLRHPARLPAPARAPFALTRRSGDARRAGGSARTNAAWPIGKNGCLGSRDARAAHRDITLSRAAWCNQMSREPGAGQMRIGQARSMSRRPRHRGAIGSSPMARGGH
jgi:hypothetical protein